MESAHPWIRTRLSAMMFIEFFVWACWMVPIGTYMGKTLKLGGDQIGWVFSATAIAAIISPLFVGYIADRLFSTERILCVLHLIGGGALILAAGQRSFPGLMSLMMINALCFMPTLALTNSLAFRNIPDPEKFPRIAVLGTIGWIASGWIVGLAMGEASNHFFYLAGGAGILMALYCLTLPQTPPKGRASGGDVLGLSALVLLKDPAFLMFVLCAFLISVPATFYFPLFNLFLTETDWAKPTALMTLAQFSEIFVMFSMPWFIAWIGLRRTLLFGMAFWALRFVFFSTLNAPLVLLGLLVHGFCYCFVYVGSYIYVDKNAPRDMRASAQSFISFLMLGVGWFLGSQLAGLTYDRYLPPVRMAVADSELAKAQDEPLTRDTWVAAQAHDWQKIWLWPAGAAALAGLIFMFAPRGKEQPAETAA